MMLPLKQMKTARFFLEGLRIGEYKISEVNNSASAMYILPADKGGCGTDRLYHGR